MSASFSISWPHLSREVIFDRCGGVLNSAQESILMRFGQSLGGSSGRTGHCSLQDRCFSYCTILFLWVKSRLIRLITLYSMYLIIVQKMRWNHDESKLAGGRINQTCYGLTALSGRKIDILHQSQKWAWGTQWACIHEKDNILSVPRIKSFLKWCQIFYA